MNESLLKFKLLTNCKGDSEKNLLEGTVYYKNGIIFVNLLKELDKNNVTYKIISGFKGKTNFNDKENHFRSIVLSVNNTDEMDLLQSIINTNFNDVLQYKMKDNKTQIKLKDT